MKKIIIPILTAAFVACFSPNLCAQWSADSKISVTDTNAALSENADICLATSGDSVHVVWWDTKKDSTAIYYRHSYDGGITWAAPMRITPFAKSVDFPSVAVSGSVVNVSWRDNSDSGSYYIHSTDGGNTWGNPLLLGAYYFWPSVACSGRNAYMTFNSSITGNSEVYFRRSSDNGATWSPVFQISNAQGRSEDQSIWATGSYIHIVWNDNRTGIMQAWYRRSSDNGASWGPETQLSNALHFSYFPMVYSNGPNVDVVRGDRDASNNFHIMYTYFNDFGTTWSAEQELSNNATSSAYPVIKRDGQSVHVVWWDFNGDLYYRRSTDGGVTWEASQSLVGVANKPGKPFIAISGPVLHLIWMDAREGHAEVYYKRNPTGNPVSKLSGKLVSLASIDFGDVKLNATSDTTITLQNTGSAALNITGYFLTDPSNGFILTDTTPHQIAPQGSTKISLRFNAVKEQAYSATITITTDESTLATHRILLSGTGVNSNIILSETQMDFGDVDTGSTVQRTFTVKNMGTLSATIDSLQIRGGAMFAIAPTQFPLTLTRGSQDSIMISFSPHQIGPAQAALWMKTSNGGWTLAATLIGNGIAKAQTFVRMTSSLLNRIEVTPNPASQNATLKISVASALEGVKINFYDAIGRLLSSQNVGAINEGMQSIPLILPQISGIAFLRIISGSDIIGTAEIMITR